MRSRGGARLPAAGGILLIDLRRCLLPLEAVGAVRFDVGGSGETDGAPPLARLGVDSALPRFAADDDEDEAELLVPESPAPNTAEFGFAGGGVAP